MSHVFWMIVRVLEPRKEEKKRIKHLNACNQLKNVLNKFLICNFSGLILKFDYVWSTQFSTFVPFRVERIDKTCLNFLQKRKRKKTTRILRKKHYKIDKKKVKYRVGLKRMKMNTLVKHLRMCMINGCVWRRVLVTNENDEQV